MTLLEGPELLADAGDTSLGCFNMRVIRTTSQVSFPPATATRAGFNGGRTDHPALQRQAPNNDAGGKRWRIY
jgi:hypothetical protein